MIYVTSDLHGRMDCLEKLLDCAHFNDDENNGGLPMLLCLDNLSAYYIEDDGSVTQAKVKS